MAIEKELLDQLLAGRDPNEVFAKDGLLDDLKKALSERILIAELQLHRQASLTAWAMTASLIQLRLAVPLLDGTPQAGLIVVGNNAAYTPAAVEQYPSISIPLPLCG